jgi:hypothetical protein
MGPKIRLYLWLFCALCWGYILYLWGGLRETPKVGEQLMKEGRFESPLAATYMFLGSTVLRPVGLSPGAQAFAARRFPRLVEHPEELEHLAVARVRAAQGVFGTLYYNLAPVLLVLSLIAHWRRQKQIRSFGTQR